MQADRGRAPTRSSASVVLLPGLLHLTTPPLTVVLLQLVVSLPFVLISSIADVMLLQVQPPTEYLHQVRVRL